MPSTAADPVAAGVTRREREVLQMVTARMANRDIAAALHLSERTVESHVSSLLRKFGARDRSALVHLMATPPTASKPAPAEAEQRHRALPRMLSSFIGRDAEIRDVTELLKVNRLVTLTGPAGAGKTRLALQVADSESVSLPVVLVDLATVRSTEEVERAFADALGVTGHDGRLRQIIRSTAAEMPLLLLIDNCEHVVDAASDLIIDLLANTSETTVLATCLGPLRVAGEVVFVVPPLPLPTHQQPGMPEAEGSAVALFTERARAVDPGFELTKQNLDAVVTICRLLDGLPLAIELAAARARYYSPAELVTLLDDRFAVLTDAARPSRHRTLEAALQWSFDLLEEDEKLLLARCSIFPTVFDHDTAARILIHPPLAPSDMVRLFPRLLDRSLISRRQGPSGTQYRLLDSVRQFAAARLHEAAEVELLQGRHADHFLTQAVAQVQDLQGGRQAAAIAWFDQHWADIRTAVHFSLSSPDPTGMWEFFAGVGLGWEVLGARGEVFDWLAVLLETELPNNSLGISAAAAATVLLSYQNVGLALTAAKRGFALAQQYPEGPELALGHFALGWALLYQPDDDSGIEHLTKARELFAIAGWRWHEALSVDAIGLSTRDLARSVEFSEQAVEMLARLGDQVWQASALLQMANRCIRAGIRGAEASDWLDRAEDLAIKAGNSHGLLHVTTFRAFLDQSNGQPVTDRLNTALAEFRKIGDSRCAARCLLAIAREQIEIRPRETLIQQARLIADEMNDPILQAAVRNAAGS